MSTDPPRVLRFTARGPSRAERAAIAAWILFVLAVATLLIVPALMVGLVAFGALAAWIGLRSLARRVRGDGRRNVRVRSEEL